MPAAGTFKCNYCYTFKTNRCKNIAAGSSKCTDCCMCHEKKCNRCPTNLPSCNSEGPRQPRCDYCGSFHSCCKYNCSKCLAEFCHEGRMSVTCNGKIYCKYCHIGCLKLHCKACLKQVESVTDCCSRCSTCCDDLGCPKVIKVKHINSMIMIKRGFCEHCSRFCLKERCEHCGHKEPVLQLASLVGSSIPTPRLSGVGEFTMNPSKRFIGLEIEVDSYDNGKPVNEVSKKFMCELTSDGSVPDGFELCTPPANGNQFVKMVEEICDALKMAGAKNTYKSGLHVHVDLSDFRYEDLRKLYLIYSKIEPEIYMIIDKRRASDKFCRMLGEGLYEECLDPVAWKHKLLQMTFGFYKTRDFSVHDKGSHGAARYQGMNISSWWIRKTVEFRMHHGTIQAHKMVHFAKMLCGIADTAMKIGSREAENWPKGIKGLLAVCPDENTKWWVALRYQYFQQKRLKINETY